MGYPAKEQGNEGAQLTRRGCKRGSKGKEMEVIGEQCFILKVKVTGRRRRSCCTRSEYKVE